MSGQVDLSSQVEVKINKGLIIPVTAALSRDGSEEDPIFSIQCYTQNPDIAILIKMERSKIVKACPTFDFFCPTRVEGFFIVAHGILSTETSKDWPLVVFVNDITVNPIPVHISERIQTQLNITEGPISPINSENYTAKDIEKTQIELPDLLHDNMPEEINVTAKQPIDTIPDESDITTVQPIKEDYNNKNNNNDETKQDEVSETLEVSFSELNETVDTQLKGNKKTANTHSEPSESIGISHVAYEQPENSINYNDMKIPESKSFDTVARHKAHSLSDNRMYDSIDELQDDFDDLGDISFTEEVMTDNMDTMDTNKPNIFSDISPAQTKGKSADNITPPQDHNSVEPEINAKLAEIKDDSVETVDSVLPQQKDQTDEPQTEEHVNQLQQQENITNYNEKMAIEVNQFRQENTNDQTPQQRPAQRKVKKTRFLPPQILRRSLRLTKKNRVQYFPPTRKYRRRKRKHLMLN